MRPINNIITTIINELVTKTNKNRIKIVGNDTELKRYRVSIGISGKEAASRLGISYRNYYRLENKDIRELPNYVLLLLKLGALQHPDPINREYLITEALIKLNEQ